MELQERNKLYEGLMEAFGPSNQIGVAVEEMAELTNALMKYKQLRAKREDVVTEIADVIICMEQMARLFGLNDVIAEKDRKLKRQAERLAKLNGDTEQPCTAADGDDPGELGELGRIETEQPTMDADEDTENG